MGNILVQIRKLSLLNWILASMNFSLNELKWVSNSWELVQWVKVWKLVWYKRSPQHEGGTEATEYLVGVWPLIRLFKAQLAIFFSYIFGVTYIHQDLSLLLEHPHSLSYCGYYLTLYKQLFNNLPQAFLLPSLLMHPLLNTILHIYIFTCPSYLTSVIFHTQN